MTKKKTVCREVTVDRLEQRGYGEDMRRRKPILALFNRLRYRLISALIDFHPFVLVCYRCSTRADATINGLCGECYHRKIFGTKAAARPPGT